MNRKNFLTNLSYDSQTIFTTLFIGLTYLWTNSAYLSWTNCLTPLAGNTVTYMATEAGGALSQVVGLFLFAWFLQHDIKNALHNKTLLLIIAFDACSILPVVLSGEMTTVLLWGLIMNLFHGAIAGYYITVLSYDIPKNRRAFCFGVGYAFGSISAYLLSLSRDLFGTTFFWFVFVLLILADGALAFSLRHNSKDSDSPDGPSLKSGYTPKTPDYPVINNKPTANNKFAEQTTCVEPISKVRITKNAAPFSTCLLAGAVILLLALTSQLALSFPAKAYLDNPAILDFSHLFYAVGLIIAAVVNDKKRNAGLILALLSLCFPLLSLSLYQIPSMLTVLSVTGYSIMGFFTVYRIVVFSDFPDDDSRLFPLASAGLFCGRVGEAAGAVLGHAIGSRHILLTVTTTLLFTVTIVAVFLLYIRLYSSKPVTTVVDRTARFYAAYELSAREQQVFLLLLDNKTNQEIAEELFISENTVKFHVKNILKKTDCQRRTDIVRKFQSYI